MSYKKVTKDEANAFTKSMVDLIVPEMENPVGNIVQVSCFKGHFEEFYMDESTFTYTVVRGAGTFFIDDERVEIAEGDTIAIPPGNRIYYFGNLQMVLLSTPAFDPKNEHHVRDITHEEFEVWRNEWMPVIKNTPSRTAFLRALPGKRGMSIVMLFNDVDRFLVLKPTYKKYWQLPGGIIDKDMSPGQIAIEEVQEELGLTIADPKLLQISYLYTNESTCETEANRFIFDGGALRQEDTDKIVISEEVAEFKFITADEMEAHGMEHAGALRKALAVRNDPTRPHYSESKHIQE